MDVWNELERLSKAATPGDWDPNIYGSLFFLTHPTEGKFPSSTDLELIATMRNNLEALIKVARAAKELADFNDQYLNNLEKNKIEWNAKDAESPYVKRIKLALAELDRTE